MIAYSMFKNFIGQNCRRTDDDIKKTSKYISYKLKLRILQIENSFNHFTAPEIDSLNY